MQKLLLLTLLAGASLLTHKAHAQMVEVTIANPCNSTGTAYYSSQPQPGMVTTLDSKSFSAGSSIMVLNKTKVISLPAKSYVRCQVGSKWVELGQVTSKGQTFTIVCK